MNIKNSIIFKEWESSTEYLANFFAKKYFGIDAETWWVGDEIGGTFVINDHYFSVTDITDFLRYSYTIKNMFDYYDYALEEAMEKRNPINIKHWRKRIVEN
jgi:hypothetical protein